jgi:hypothetical protein
MKRATGIGDGIYKLRYLSDAADCRRSPPFEVQP